MSTPNPAIPSDAQEFCLSPVMQCPPPLPEGDLGLQGGLEQQPLCVPPGPSCTSGMPAPREEEEESMEEVVLQEGLDAQLVPCHRP